MILSGSKDRSELVAGNGLLKLALLVIDDDVDGSIDAALTPPALVEVLGQTLEHSPQALGVACQVWTQSIRAESRK